MAIRVDCRHYLRRSTPTGEATERCRLAMNQEMPFSCADGCLFYEQRAVSGPGWAQAPSTPMSNTAHGLLDLPPAPKKRRKGKKKR